MSNHKLSALENKDPRVCIGNGRGSPWRFSGGRESGVFAMARIVPAYGVASGLELHSGSAALAEVNDVALSGLRQTIGRQGFSTVQDWQRFAFSSDKFGMRLKFPPVEFFKKVTKARVPLEHRHLFIPAARNPTAHLGDVRALAGRLIATRH